MKERKHSSNTALRHLSPVIPPETSIATIPDAQLDPRSQWVEQVRHSGMWPTRPARLGPSPTFTTAIPSTDLISSLPKTHHARSPEELSSNILSAASYSMRLSQAVVVISSLAAACEAFRFTVWLGDKCTISGTGTKPSDQELLVIPQTVDNKGCMVRALATIRLAVCMS
jgi:hypothetical protein